MATRSLIPGLCWPTKMYMNITITEMMAPMNDSKRSAPRPPTSPTLSPTLSAMVAGFLGSSSGMWASTLPTMSAAISAALV